ncbi:MAG TPA: PHP domain-containing protein, partial [Methanolinea sp.]|nr:PHP domain-containing protein [Methanolinea sp.]
MLACDLHIHTDHSRDGESSVEEVIRRAEAAGLDAIAITDHDT